ncbi:MAG: Ig-like domain-containing protein [Spirochaetes bacterium]|nr:Ig-like domain-containing protein [Spirochaetota bacterium]
MKHTISAITVKDITKRLALFRKTILAGFMAAAMAAPMAGCNGKIYSALFDDNMANYLVGLVAYGQQIDSIAITPAPPATGNTPSGVPVDYIITATLNNGNTRPLTVSEYGNVVWSWEPSGSSTILDIDSVTVENLGINNLPRITAIKSDYIGDDEQVTLTATIRDASSTTDLVINDAELVSIDVTPGTASITRLAVQQFTATGTFTDGSEHDVSSASWIVWESDDELIATVDGAGLATGMGAGTAHISADDGGVISDSATLEVTNPTLESVSVSPITKTIAAGTYVQYRATAIYDNNTTQDVTEAADWSIVAGGDGAATIDNGSSKGLAQGVSSGTDTVRATFDSVDGDATITVTGATLEYIVITAAGNKTSIAAGTKLQFTATGVFSDNSTQNITNDPLISWGTTDDTRADYIPGDAPGLITGIAAGTTVVSASLGGVDSQDYDLTVTAATLESILISPRDPVAYVIAYGTTQQFTVTGTFSDATTQNLTTQVDWDSSDDTVANIDDNGLATTATTVGVTAISAGYPAGGPYAETDSTNLQVISMPLTSITITPSGRSTYVGATFQYTAMGTFTDPGNGDTYNLDITNLVLWESDDTNLDVSNSAGSFGLATALSVGDGTAHVTATRGVVTSNTSTVTIAASDTTAPTMVSAQLLVGDKVKVTFSEPMDYTTAMAAENYKVLTTSTLNTTNPCSTSDNLLFENNTETISVTSVEFFTQSVYILQLGGGTSATQYTVIGDRADLRDVAGTPNALGCPNTATFNGVDTVKPYLVSVVNSEPTKLIVKYSEPMTTGGGISAADNISNYTIAEDPTNGLPEDDVSISGITMIDESTFILNLDKSAQSIRYRLTVAAGVADQAPTPNTMGSPRILTFTGNEQLKVVSAMAVDLTHIEVTFSKPVLSGNDVEDSAECDDATECHTKYKLFPRNGTGTEALLGDITSAVRGTGNETNTVILTHANDQEGFSYTVVAANGISGDGFDNTTVSIKAEAGTTDYMQASPKDRATFTGLGDVIDEITDGEYFTDPFADGSVFTWSFVYSGKVYLGTNDYNNAAFRFDADGGNSVLTTFGFSAGTCSTADGFGYGTIGVSPTCGVDSGPNAEVGVVGFNSGVITIGTTNYDVLMVGPLKDGVSHCYYTQDVDTELDWTQFSFAGTGGGNTDSIQTSYAYGANMYMAASSTQGQQAPVVCRLPFTDPESDGVLNPGTAVDMSLRSINYIGKQGSPYDNYGGTSEVVGIDVFLSFNNRLYIANNGGVVYSANYDTMALPVRSHPDAFRPDDGDVPEPTSSEETLVLPAAPAGLGKLSPGERGVPRLIEYNGKLYMARNVAYTSARNTVIRGELWKCSPATTGGATTCEPDDWERIITGMETDLPDSNVGDVNVTGNAISLLQNNGSTRLYVGFDHPSGVTVWRVASTDPGPTTGTMASVWTQAGNLGLDNSHIKLYSSATIYDGTYDYIYLTAGDDTNAIRVYRQRE